MALCTVKLQFSVTVCSLQCVAVYRGLYYTAVLYNWEFLPTGIHGRKVRVVLYRGLFTF
jgi:hypothetical protein